MVIPAYNESANLRAGSLKKVTQYLAAQPYTYEVLVVDDGSTDDSAALAEQFCSSHPQCQLIRNPHRGKAHTVLTGMLGAQGALVLFTDMDQATPIEETAKLLPWFEKGYDVVIGSRGTVRRNAPIWRKAMSRSQMLLRNVILGFRDVTDTQCGFKAFRGSEVANIIGHLHFYKLADAPEAKGATVTAGFDVELLFVCKKLGYKIREVPVNWDYRFTRRVNLLKDSLRGIRELLDIRLADLRGVYKHQSQPINA